MADKGPSAERVIEVIAAAIEAPDSPRGTRKRLAALAEMLRRFREQPVGGRFMPFKRLAFHFLASAFDRQMRIQEAMSQILVDFHCELAAMRDTASEKVPGAAAAPAPNVPGTSHPPPGGRLHVALAAPAEMLLAERLLLYGLVRGLRPQYCLEVGTFRGGSSLIIASALDDNGKGTLACVDPNPQVSEETWLQIHHRSRLIPEGSPQGLASAAALAPGGFSFAFIDGDHTYEGVLRDIEGMLPILAPDAQILFHDCHYGPVKDAVDEALRRHGDRMVDCGVLTVDGVRPQGEAAFENGREVVWGGLRLIRYSPPSPS